MDHFIAAMRGQGMQVVTQAPEGARTARFNLAQQYDALGTIRGAGIGVQHVRWGRQSGEGQGAFDADAGGRLMRLKLQYWQWHTARICWGCSCRSFLCLSTCSVCKHYLLCPLLLSTLPTPPPYPPPSPWCSVSCPAFHLPADLFVKHERLVFAAASAMELQQPLLDTLLQCALVQAAGCCGSWAGDNPCTFRHRLSAHVPCRDACRP